MYALRHVTAPVAYTYIRDEGRKSILRRRGGGVVIPNIVLLWQKYILLTIL